MTTASTDLSRGTGTGSDAGTCHPARQTGDRTTGTTGRTIPVAGPPVIEVVNVSKSFGRARVLNAVSLSLVKGEVLALCGPSGSGKSTLLRCINGLETVDHGTVRVLGVIIGSGQAKTGLFRSRIGMVFQRPGLYPHMSVLDNITLALRRVRKLSRQAADERAHGVLAQVGIGDKADAKPVTLSGGQQQRVAIARALVLDPEVLLLDEPTSALDPERVREVLDVLRHLARTGITMAIATHELGFARQVAHRVAFLDEGAVLEITPAAAFFEKPATARAEQFLDNLIHR